MERAENVTGPGRVFGIGVGPGDPELMTVKAVRLLAACPVVAYPATETGESLARAIAAPHIADGKTEIPIRIPIHGHRFPDGAIYAQAAERISAELGRDRDVAVLCEGDPFFYGSFMYLYALLVEGGHGVEVVPGVSSLTACAAVLGYPLAARNDVLSIVPAPLAEDALRTRLAAADAAAIIKLGRHFAKVRNVLSKLGLSANARYIQHATMAGQIALPLDEVEPTGVPYFSMILMRRGGAAWR